MQSFIFQLRITYRNRRVNKVASIKTHRGVNKMDDKFFSIFLRITNQGLALLTLS